jgi:hypothetical protein
MKISLLSTFRIIAVTGCLTATAGQASADSGWHTYCNARFGQCADIPQDFKSDPPPENGDGLIFRDAGGMSVTVSGSYNVNSSVLGAEQRAILEAKPVPAYQAKGPNWFVVSGSEGDRIYYIRKIVTPEIIATLWIEYPSTQKEKYGPLIAKISKSFRLQPVKMR